MNSHDHRNKQQTGAAHSPTADQVMSPHTGLARSNTIAEKTPTPGKEISGHRGNGQRQPHMASEGTADRQRLDALQADRAPAAVDTEVNNSKAKATRDEVMRRLREQLVRGVPPATDRETLQALKRQLDRGAVEIKVHTRRPLHGTTYISAGRTTQTLSLDMSGHQTPYRQA